MISDSVAAASYLANEAARRGVRPPLQLTGPLGVVRGWQLLMREGDALAGDEFGELWWGRASSAGVIRILRPCWPEEISALRRPIEDEVERILGDARPSS
jgi:hypothetical protein